MEIELTNTRAYIQRASPAEYAWLTVYMTVDVPEAHRAPKRQVATALMEDVPQTFCALNVLSRSFPAGLAVNLLKQAHIAGFDVGVQDTRERVCALELAREHVAWLRDYQWSAVCQLVRRGGRGILHAVTGAGKTEMCIALTRVLPCEWLFLVHRADLVGQTAERYALRTSETAGTFDAGVWKKGTCNFTVSTFQAIQAALRRHQGGKAVKLFRGAKDVQGLLAETEALFVDECHGLSGGANACTLDLFTNAFYRVGASSTPLNRTDKATLQTLGCLGPVLATIGKDELVARGVLAQSRIHMLACGQWASRSLEWLEVYSLLVVRSAKRNALLCAMTSAASKPALLFVDQLEHVQLLSALLWESGIPNDVVAGDVHKSVRTTKIESLVRGDIEVLISTVVFQEGVDIPSLGSVIIGGGKQSDVACLQRIGRGMRSAAGKTEFEVWDVLDEGHWWTEKHALSRRLSYEQAGHEVLIGW